MDSPQIFVDKVESKHFHFGGGEAAVTSLLTAVDGLFALLRSKEKNLNDAREALQRVAEEAKEAADDLLNAHRNDSCYGEEAFAAWGTESSLLHSADTAALQGQFNYERRNRKKSIAALPTALLELTEGDFRRTILAEEEQQYQSLGTLMEVAKYNDERNRFQKNAYLKPVKPLDMPLSDYATEVREALKAYCEKIRELINGLKDEEGDPKKDDATVEGEEDDDNDNNDDDDYAQLLTDPTMRTFALSGDFIDDQEEKTCAEWVAHLPSAVKDAAYMNGVTYSIGQCRMMLLKAEDILGKLDVQKTTPWLPEFATRGIDPAVVADLLCAVFVYTVDCKDCNCKSLVECQSRQAVQKNNHKKPAPQPTNRNLHGSNSAPWAVMNWTMRVGFSDGLKSGAEGVQANARVAAEFFRPLRQRIEACLSLLPRKRRVVFRGVSLPVARKYKLDSAVLFPPFTSTSVVGTEALKFMSSDREGTFFIIRVHSATMIDFVSWFPGQEEALLTCFTAFKVKSKYSRSLLTMLGCKFDIVMMTEDGDSPTDDEAATAVYASVSKTTFIYDNYLSTYIMARVSSGPPPQTDTIPLHEYIDSWVNTDVKHMVLLGAPGAGKTSAALGCLSYLIERKSAPPCFLNWRSKAKTTKPNLPIFVSMPAIPNALDEDNAIDQFMCDFLSLSRTALDVMAEKYSIFIILDSMDEVPRAPQTKYTGVVARNAWLKNTAVAISCRDEFLRLAQVQPWDVTGTKSNVIYIQPFTAEDCFACVEAEAKKFCADKSQVEETIKKWKRVVSELTNAPYISNPCTLHMILEVVKRRPPEQMRKLRSLSMIYEAFIVCFVPEIVSVDYITIAMENIAIKMISNGVWQLPLSIVVQYFEYHTPEEALTQCLPYVPCRVEDLHTLSNQFAFWHKSMGEYLCARCFFECPDRVRNVTFRFCKTSANVLFWYSQLATMDAEAVEKHEESVRNVFLPIVQKTREDRSEEALTAASNAMALIFASNFVPVGVDFSDTVIEDCILFGANLHCANFKNATFRRCILNDAGVDNADLDGCSFPASTTGFPITPVEHPKRVVCTAINTDATVLATGCRDMKVRLVSMTNGECLAVLEGHTDQVAGVQFNSDSTLLASASWDLSVRIWDVAKKTQINKFTALERGFTCVVFHTSKPYVIAGSLDSAFRMFNYKTGELVKSIKAHASSITDLAIAPERGGSLIATSSADGSVRIWDKNGDPKEILQTGKLHSEKVHCVDITTDGTKAIGGTENGDILLWKIATGKIMITLSGHQRAVFDIKLSPDQTRVYSSSEDQTVRIWELASGKELRQVRLDSAVSNIAITNDGTRIALTKLTQVRVWDAAARRFRPPIGHKMPVNMVAVSYDGQYCASCAEDRTVRLWELCSGRQLNKLRFSTMANCVAFSDNGEYVFAGDQNKTIQQFVRENGKCVASYVGHKKSVSAVAARTALLASGSNNAHVHLWSFRRDDGKTEKSPLHILSSHDNAVKSIVITKDESKVISCSWVAIIVWNTAAVAKALQEGNEKGAAATKPAKLYTLSGHKLFVDALFLSERDNNVLVSGGMDRSVRLWSLKDGKQKAMFRHPMKVVRVGLRENEASGEVDEIYGVSDDNRVVSWKVTDAPKSLADADMNKVHW